MKADYYQPAAVIQQVDEARQSALELIQLAVDGNADRLKGARRWMDLPPATRGALNNSCQLLGSINRPAGDYRASDGTSPWLFTVSLQDIGQFLRGRAVDDIRLSPGPDPSSYRADRCQRS